MKKNFNFRKYDWTFNCMICGNKCFASESYLLGTYTGRGGLRVCQSCNDPVDYGLVPYKIPSEKPIPWSADAMNTSDPQNIAMAYGPFDYVNFDPLGTAPFAATAAAQEWENLLTQTWDAWSRPWGT